MKKRILERDSSKAPSAEDQWLDLATLADVEITSEDPAYPVESALLPGTAQGWRAAGPGPQTLRLLFTQPQTLHRILLEFEELSMARTQEFVLRWSSSEAQPLREIVRQQWNFSPGGGEREVEDLQVELAGVSVLELEIIPDISRGSAVASLQRMRLA